MGIFQSRPEEPSEWGGLPSEPLDARGPAEVLPPPVDDLGILGAAGVAISVPVEVFLDDQSGDNDTTDGTPR